jgi:hypothetical protein
MGIDRIDKGSPPGGIGSPDAAGSSAVTPKESFEVEKVADPTAIDASSPLARLRAGEIDVESYLDLRVEQATNHLVGTIDDERLEVIRSSLRAQLETDPILMDLVQRATVESTSETRKG